MAPSALDKLVSERDACSDTLLRVDSKIKDHVINPLQEVIVTRLMDEVTDATADLKNVHTRIRASFPDDMEPHKQAYWTLLDLADSLINALHGIKANFKNPAAIPIVKTKNNVVRLPQLELNSFDGNLLEWISFRDMFSSSVHNNVSLSNSQKFTYLKSLLKGEPSKQISNIILTDANYDIAWQQLNDRYQNDREILFAILRRFHGQQVASASSCAIRSLVDTTKECLRSFDILNMKADKSSEAMMLFVLTTKLDPQTRELWEQSLKGTAIPPLNELLEFLEQRSRAMAAGSFLKPRPVPENQKRIHAHHGQSNGKCKICSESPHSLYKCTKFTALTISGRQEAAKKHNLCFNCLQEGHSIAKCLSSGRCKNCQGKHHSLLHKLSESNGTPPSVPPTVQPPSSTSGSSAVACHSRDDLQISQTILATAMISVVGNGGQQYLCRALLDGGSTTSFISDSCCRRIGLQRTKNSTEVFGLAAAQVGTARGITSLVFGPHFSSNHSFSVNALILSKVTGRLPIYPCSPASWPHLDGVTLADPEFYRPATIDVLLGSDIFWDLLDGERRIGPPGTPLGISSALGMIVAGNIASNTNTVQVHVAETSLDLQLQKFWDLEAIPDQRPFTTDELKCEALFDANHSRDNTGRFTVALPFKEPRPVLGLSRDIAQNRLKQLERRFSRDSKYQQQYIDFMREYLALGHMSLVPLSELHKPLNPTYYIPHHLVLKDDSTTTKLRVVFDASAKTTSGKSLNDSMLVGPTLQDNLVDIVMRFRIHPYAFSADIAKMYRQIRVTEKDADLQRILWRESPADEIKDYRLETVTYGTAAAPYLAVKVLQQLAEYEKSSLPVASEIAKSDFYVDDLMGGAPTIEEAIQAQTELLELMRRGGLSLRKWSSNCEKILDNLPKELRESNTSLDITLDPLVKTLGIRWNTRQDRFEFQYNDSDLSEGPYSKRRILSEMSKLFDPLGWLSPIIIIAKILMQDLWKIEANWDEPLSITIQTFWIDFKLKLKHVSEIYVPRCMIPMKPTHIYLAGFCDASEKAYGAVVYLCVFFATGCQITLVTSKTRVAPAKQVSLPRLELCGAALLATLMETVKKALKLNINKMCAWTDSTVVLAWIRSHPSRWQNFVANRVTIIQNILPASCWSHVPGVENPSDCCSRGMGPTELSTFSLWWNGPTWLSSMSSYCQTPTDLNTDGLQNVMSIEERKVAVVATARVLPIFSLLDKYSNLTQLVRITAWILRFCSRHKSVKSKGPLTPMELNEALMKWTSLVQQQCFHIEIEALKKKQPISSKSSLLRLHPFLDEKGLLRVGGRLRNAAIPQDQKTPLLLPRHSRLTELIITSKHKEHLHAGPTLLLAILQQKFWILRARDAVRFLVRKCVVCTRHSAVTQQQFMADLPLSRVTPCRAFKKCGVDYAGPFLLKPDLKRSKVTIKAYLALFVCFTTRAFHLEVVSSLSTDAFLAAFRRFVSRRGLPSDVYSDCGTNFVGANRELKEMLTLVNSKNHNTLIAHSLAPQGVSWHFNPPGAPHFGGLWEAGVKSVKYHLNRIVGSTRLTFEEMTTTMVQVEACLNSRPLSPFSSDPNDLSALTSGHFLIGEPLLATPEPDLSSITLNKLSRWQLIQTLQQQFWKRWSSEYLARLQQRPKWLQHRKDLVIGDLVLIKQDNLPPLKWRLGRVIGINPGSDGIVRVTTLKTEDGETTRNITKLCLLPIFEDTEPSSDVI